MAGHDFPADGGGGDGGRRFAWLGNVGVRGVLPPLLGKLLRDTHESIVAMNQALAREVERLRNGCRLSRPMMVRPQGP